MTLEHTSVFLIYDIPFADYSNLNQSYGMDSYFFFIQRCQIMRKYASHLLSKYKWYRPMKMEKNIFIRNQQDVDQFFFKLNTKFINGVEV